MKCINKLGKELQSLKQSQLIDKIVELTKQNDCYQSKFGTDILNNSSQQILTDNENNTDNKQYCSKLFKTTFNEMNEFN